MDTLDIAITVFNQEEIIERVLYGIFTNTTTPFNLIILFDGCTDRTKERALNYINRYKPRLLKLLISHDTPNLFELRANNAAFKLAQTDYLIAVQDDMVIQEFGWERRLTYPLRIYDDVFAVTARVAEDVVAFGADNLEKYENRAGVELGTLDRNTFAIRDVINRGPIAFRRDYLHTLNYLSERYLPCALDDTDISLRAWRDHKWRVGAYWIQYWSHPQWSKVNDSDSTMGAWTAKSANLIKLNEDHGDYIHSREKHTEDRSIPEQEVDYIKNSRKPSMFTRIVKYPYRIDKRVLKARIRLSNAALRRSIKMPFTVLLSLLLGKNFEKLQHDVGFKKALKKTLQRK